MGHVTEASDIRVEPDILQWGPNGRGGPAPSRLRKLLGPGLFMAGAGAALLAVQFAGGPVPPGTAPVVPAAVAPPRLSAPQTAKSGERITVLGFRDGRLCGPAELRFDGTPVAHRLAAFVGPLGLDHQQFFLTMEVPRSAAPGRHEIALYGPAPSGPGGRTCTAVSERQAELAAVSVVVLASAGGTIPETRRADRFRN